MHANKLFYFSYLTQTNSHYRTVRSEVRVSDNKNISKMCSVGGSPERELRTTRPFLVVTIKIRKIRYQNKYCPNI